MPVFDFLFIVSNDSDRLRCGFDKSGFVLVIDILCCLTVGFIQLYLYAIYDGTNISNEPANPYNM